jgi:uncharacterized protein YjiK
MPAKPGFMPVYTALFVLCTACGASSGKSFVPRIDGYQEKLKEVFILKKKLLEISGIAFIENDKLAAINDEKGELFFLDLKTDSSTSYKFSDKGDYEEVVKTDSGYYVLDSNGDIYELMPPDYKAMTYKFHSKKIEFESMVWYKKLNKLVTISKEQRDKKAGITAYSFDLNKKEFDPQPFFNISYKEVFVQLENYNAECKPSGAAINPVNNNLYIVASVGKLLIECTPEGKLLKIYKLNPAHFPQPEGITFATNGDMYISNEGIEGKSTILKFPYGATK